MGKGMRDLEGKWVHGKRESRVLGKIFLIRKVACNKLSLLDGYSLYCIWINLLLVNLLWYLGKN